MIGEKIMAIENLITNVDEQIIKIRTKSLDISFNELYDMYNNEELRIAPDYQRLFRWGKEKQSRFIESLILEMPVPPIFVIETEEGIYELIDGLQRISSYLHFRGSVFHTEEDETEDETEKEDETEDNNFLKLQGCDIISDLNGMTFDTLPKVLQIKLKRTFVRMEVIKKESEPSLKYHMFKRLNTGGEILSDQEIRNCTIRLLGSKAISFIEKCSYNKNFKNVICRIGDEKINTKYDQELVLRFFAIKNDIDNYKYPVTEFLTNYLEDITTGKKDFDFDKEANIFEKTFEFIDANMGADAFSTRTVQGNMRSDFTLYCFDGISVPLACWIENVKEGQEQAIVDKIEEIKFGDEIQSYKTGSVNGVKTRIRLFTEGVKSTIDTGRI
jgi:hypothetical protein